MSASRRAVAGRILTHRNLTFVVVVGRDLVRARKDLVHRRVEPAIDVAPNQLAPDDEHDQRRHQRHDEQQRDQLGPKTRERQASPPLHHHFDDVARQHEDERQQHREVGRRQGVKDELGQEVRRETGRAIGERENADERRRKNDDGDEDQPGVVAERAPGGRRRRDRGNCTSGRNRRDGRRHSSNPQSLSPKPQSLRPTLWRSANPSARS